MNNTDTTTDKRLLMAALARKALHASSAMSAHARSVLEELSETRDPSQEPCPFCNDWHTTDGCPR